MLPFDLLSCLLSCGLCFCSLSLSLSLFLFLLRFFSLLLPLSPCLSPLAFASRSGPCCGICSSLSPCSGPGSGLFLPGSCSGSGSSSLTCCLDLVFSVLSGLSLVVCLSVSLVEKIHQIKEMGLGWDLKRGPGTRDLGTRIRNKTWTCDSRLRAGACDLAHRT